MLTHRFGGHVVVDLLAPPTGPGFAVVTADPTTTRRKSRRRDAQGAQVQPPAES